MQAVAVAQLANFALGDAGQFGQTGIGEALAFQGAQERFVQAVDARFGHLFFRAHQLFNLHQNQRSTLVRLKTPSTDRPARKASAMYQMRSEPASFSSRRILVSASGSSSLLSGRSRWHPLPDRAALLQRLLLGAADGHHFADRLHLGGQAVVGAGELLEVEARILVTT